MLKSETKIETQPGVVFLSQIIAPQGASLTAEEKKEMKEISQSLKQWEVNLSLPLLCLSNQEDKYHLLTGVKIYQSAVESGLDKIWAVLISAKKTEAQKAVEQFILQSKVNEKVVDNEDITEFLNFLNTAKKPELMAIPGIKDGYATKIMGKRPFNSEKDLKKLGDKQPWIWLKAFGQKKR